MAADPTLAIEASGLVKSFGETRAVDGVDLRVRRGAVYGVLGPNGAGKTTTIRMLATLIRPDAGSGTVIAEGTPSELKASVGAGALHVRLVDPQQRAGAAEVLERELGTVELEADPTALSAACSDADRAAEAVAKLTRTGVRIAGFSLGQPSLDEVFLALTGHTAQDAEDESTIIEEQAA